MAVPAFLQEGRMLTPEAFDFLFTNELKRAVRAQNFLTLLVLEPGLAGVRNGRGVCDGHVVQEIARVVRRDVRETDLLAETPAGRLSVVLFDADLASSIQVVNRLLTRLAHYAFATPIEIAIGAACCPTHGADAASLRREAETSKTIPLCRTPASASS